jgi:hypothetical protein
MQRRLTIVFAFALLLLLASVASAARNPATGTDVDPWSRYTPVPVRHGVTEVLWDTTHGVCFGYEPSGVYADLVALLVGFNFTTTSAGIDNIDLSPYDILVINAGSACSTTYTANEVAAVQSFVATGGRVLIMGDNPFAWVWNINPVAQILGATTGVETLPADLFSNLSSHPIFNGIEEVYYRLGGSLNTIGVMQPQAWTDDGNYITVAVSESPCVVVLGDINGFGEPEFFNQADNQAFAVNVFNWLATCGGTISVDEKSWGSIKSSYRK